MPDKTLDFPILYNMLIVSLVRSTDSVIDLPEFSSKRVAKSMLITGAYSSSVFQ